MTKFSVLLSVYKNEDPSFLNDALDSILVRQSVLPDQVVVVKDGYLNDELDAVLMKYSELFKTIVIIIGYDINKGLGFALNFGLKYCSNEIIFRMDTDDISVYNRFEIQLEAFFNYPYLSLIGSFIEEFENTPGDLDRFRKVPVNLENIQLQKLNRNPFNHMTVGFKKSIIDSVGGYEELPGYEDYYLWIKLLKEHSGFNIETTLVHARVGNNMIGRRQGFEFFKKELAFQKKILNDGFQSIGSFFKNFLLRCLPRLLPVKMLEFIYTNILRN